MIERIARLRGYGVFRDFTWPSNLSDFGKNNLIYGWNGSGKTMLSRVFRALEQRAALSIGEATVRIDGRDVEHEAFPQVTTPVRVFNRDFVHESVFPINGGDVPPIYVFGKESVDKQKEAESFKQHRAEKEASLINARANKQEAEKGFEKFCSERAKVIKDTLQMTGSAYNNYNNPDYKAAAQKMVADGNASANKLDDKKRSDLLAQHQAKPKSKIPTVTYQFPNIQALVDQVSTLLRTTVVSAAIQSLKDDAKLADWLRNGLILHKERQSQKCLFCEQALPSDRLSALEAHFSAEYEQFLQKIEEQVQELEAYAKAAGHLKLPNRAEIYDDLASAYDDAQETLSQAIDAFQNVADVLIQALNTKKGQPFTAQKLEVSLPTIPLKVVEQLNEVIEKHNQACDNFDKWVREARDRLALDEIARDLDEFIRLRANLETADDLIRENENAVQELTSKIDLLERQIVMHRQPAEDLNKDLKDYLGHGEIQLAIKDTGYSITRNGEPAKMLSEGEMTAIALLYFLKSLEDRGFNRQNGVVVIDDPVSSLDANALFVAFALIRKKTQDARQLFILTHNFTLFRQVRNWFDHINGKNKGDVKKRPARFYMLNCLNDQNGRHTSINALDPLLENYESEYHYLFSCVYQASLLTKAADLEKNYFLPNMARRLLEAFLAFRQPHISGELWQQMRALKFDEHKKIRILRFLHTNSHASDIGGPEHDPSVLAEGNAVLKDLLELIESQDPDHFKAMIETVSAKEKIHHQVEEKAVAP